MRSEPTKPWKTKVGSEPNSFLYSLRNAFLALKSAGQAGRGVVFSVFQGPSFVPHCCRRRGLGPAPLIGCTVPHSSLSLENQALCAFLICSLPLLEAREARHSGSRPRPAAHCVALQADSYWSPGDFIFVYETMLLNFCAS